jgi:hypothetical protein
MTGFETWRQRANQWQTWFAITLVAVWVILYAFAAASGSRGYRISSGYWPDHSTGLVIPFQGAAYRLDDTAQTIQADARDMVALGEHNGIKFFARPGERQGGGGGFGGQVYPRLYVADGLNRWLPFDRVAVDPNAGRFLP